MKGCGHIGINFNEIFITDAELGILKSLSSGEVLLLHPVTVQNLIQLDFIFPYLLSETDNEYVIAPAGLRYLAFLSKQESTIKADSFRYWLPMIIANCISIAALIVSIVK